MEPCGTPQFRSLTMKDPFDRNDLNHEILWSIVSKAFCRSKIKFYHLDMRSKYQLNDLSENQIDICISYGHFLGLVMYYLFLLI